MLWLYEFNISLSLLTLKSLFLTDGNHLLLVSNKQNKQLSTYLLNLEAPNSPTVELYFKRMIVSSLFQGWCCNSSSWKVQFSVVVTRVD